MANSKYVIIYTSMLFAFLVVQKFDYDDKLAEFDKYCHNVKEHVHPDYKKIYHRCEV